VLLHHTVKYTVPFYLAVVNGSVLLCHPIEAIKVYAYISNGKLILWSKLVWPVTCASLLVQFIL